MNLNNKLLLLLIILLINIIYFLRFKWSRFDDLAKQSLEVDKNNNTGFLNVYYKDGLWHYRGSDLKSPSLEVLEKKVLASGLEWRETDSNLAYKNMKLDLRKFKK